MSEFRCQWAQKDPVDRDYHDTEWGVPIHDSRMLWETLMLEGFQAGLSWNVILRKREAFRKAFSGFEPAKVARFTEPKILKLLEDPGIVRSRAKIEATIAAARIYLDMARHGEPFDAYCWSFTQGKTICNQGKGKPTQSDLSVAISKDLKKRGFKFVGPTIVYAWLQAVGIVNDHDSRCFRAMLIRGCPDQP